MRFQISDSGFQIQDFGFQIQDYGFQNLDFGLLISDLPFIYQSNGEQKQLSEDYQPVFFIYLLFKIYLKTHP